MNRELECLLLAKEQRRDDLIDGVCNVIAIAILVVVVLACLYLE
jgi:hypothetical protein